RNMLHDVMPGTEEQLNKEMTTGYIGFDPTADSLGVGNLVQVMTLLHFQRCGHKPIALVGGATGMVGDPSGKSAERNLLSEDILNHNLDSQKKQLEKFLNFDCGANSAEIVNNYDWFKDFTFLDFIRDVGKHITVNYMMAKDSVKSRLDTGMSFTEFSYQLVQGYDFVHLHQHKNCMLQMGGSDQWGNIVTGTELLRRKTGASAFALTTPLIKKADGTKFGKTEGGNIWLNAARTSPYKFYQFWLNASDDDVKNYIRIFSIRNREEIEVLEKQHNENAAARILQKTLAQEITTRVHSEADYNSAVEASEILFGKAATESLKALPEATLLDVMEGVPQTNVSHSSIAAGINTQILPSRSEAKKLIQAGGISINKEKVDDTTVTINVDRLLNNKYLLIQKGKKNYYLVICED
ncbi:MAG TPA: tyrosine--tRNA ligase, partial [Bacteroidia bacterium]|nr:tyrosine--tRNA ligase [Bacteroidia bacterium]